VPTESKLLGLEPRRRRLHELPRPAPDSEVDFLVEPLELEANPN